MVDGFVVYVLHPPFPARISRAHPRVREIFAKLLRLLPLGLCLCVTIHDDGDCHVQNHKHHDKGEWVVKNWRSNCVSIHQLVNIAASEHVLRRGDESDANVLEFFDFTCVYVCTRVRESCHTQVSESSNYLDTAGK